MGVGAVFFLLGGALWLGSRVGWLRFGRLPGDIAVHRNGFSFYFPIVTCLLLSLVGTLALWLVGSLRR